MLYPYLLLIAVLCSASSAIAQPTVTSTPVETAEYGEFYQYDITTDNWIGAPTITLESSIPGLSLQDNGDGTAVLSGTVSGAGTFPVEIKVVDGFLPILQGTQNFDLVISKAVLVAKANNQSRIYGGTNPPFTISYTGFKFSDNAAGIDTPPVGVPAATSTSSPGNYAINVNIASALDDHYTFTPQSGTLNITPAPLTITADDKTKVYGAANPVYTVSYSGLQNGETAASLASQPTASTAGVDETTGVGDHTIALTGGSSPNYTITRVDGELHITKATLLVKADNQTRVYGDANPALTISYSGFVNGDTPTALTSLPTIGTTAGNTTGVSGVAITVSGGSDDNYDLTYQNGTLTITKASLTITADNQSRPYFQNNPPLTLSYSGFKNSETSAVFSTQPTVSTTANQNTFAGTVPITVTGTVAANYNVNHVNGTLTITKIALIAKADNQSRAYGAANPPLTISYTGFVNGDNATDLQTPPVATTAATSTSAATTYPITVNVSGALDENYTFTPQSGTLTVTKATLTVTADAKTKVYGAALPPLTITYSGFAGSDNASSLTTQPTVSTTATPSSNAGNYPITASGGVSNNYDFNYVDGNLSISKALLTITADDKTKVYGASMPTLTFQYAGFIGSDNAGSITPPTISTAATASSNANTYTITLTGGSATNYNITLVNGTLTITKATLTATADDKSRLYGAANPPLTVTYSGFVNGDGVANITQPTISTSATTTSPVTQYPIVVTGGASTNYTFNNVNGILTVGKAPLTATADAKAKVYGAANPPLTITYSGFQGSDNASSITQPSIATTATTASHVGGYPITLTGGNAVNYDLTLANGTLTVSKAPLTITANDLSKTYGTANPALTVTYSGFVGSDNASVFTSPLVVTTTAVTNSPATTYPITPSGAVADDYNISFVAGTLTVNKAVLTVTADDKTRTYGAANPPFTVSYTGFVGSDNSGSITQPTASSAATTTSNVGTYAIVPSGGTAANYTFNYVNGTLNVTKAPLTITAQDATRIYGVGEPTFNVSYSGFVNSQNSSVLTTAPSVTTVATISSDVGQYDINASGAAAQNYTFTYVKGTLTITKATITATADNKTRTYGAANPTFTISYAGFKNSQDASVITTQPTASTTATVTSPAGPYPITLTGGSATNYQFSYAAGTLTVDKATLLATAVNKSKLYGATNPPFTLTYTGLLNGDVAADIQTAPTMSTTATTTSSVGTYPINITGGADQNYTFIYAAGTLSIGKAPLTVTADTKTKVYGADNPTLTITYSGFQGSDNSSAISQPSISTTATAASHVGSYPITLTGGSATNYDLTLNNGSLSVTKATLSLTANNQSRTYGAANPALTIAYSGFTNGDTPAVLDTPPLITTTAVATSPVGNYPITLSGGADNDYILNFTAGSLTVTKAVLTVTADNKSRVYNTANPTFTLTYSGFLNTDNALSISPPTASTSATITSAVGDYSINLSGGTATNYTFSFNPGTLTITKGTPVITWNTPTAITYGTALGASQLNATSNVAGDFVYNPASGTVLAAGTHTLSVNFTPSDATNYNPVNNTTVQLVVGKATPVITWANPAAITYGTTLSSTQLNATSNVAGTFTYTPASGALLSAGTTTLKVDFHPADPANYNDVNNTQRSITVNKATPTVTWNNPAAITYGTPLGSTQLNATFSVPGTPTYVPGAGTILPTGANQAITVNFTPTDAVNYNSLSNVQALITVIKATPVITWSNPADITYGTPLSGTQLNATSTVAGTFTYTPASGTILPAGAGQTLSTSFTPTDATNYNSVTSTTVTINVGKANPVITWANPSAITYPAALSATQLNATSSVPGSFTYNPVSGTVLNAGPNQPISSTFTPTDVANYNTIVTNKTIMVNKATPVVTWNSPAQIVYGTPLTATQQNATANVPGTFDYTPAAGTILNTGANQNISVKFTPNDLVNYNVVNTTTTQITVIKATPVVTWNTPLPIKVGVALSGTQLNATANVAGTMNYTPAAGTTYGTEGTYTLSVAFTPADLTNYNTVPVTQVPLTVSSKDNPVITWSNPSAITYGTALSATQLNATASVPGTFAYSPASGTKLDAGAAQTLTVTFTPTDMVNYNVVNKSVSINVNKAPLTATAASASRAYGNSNPSFVINYSGFVNGDAAAVLDTPPTATCAALVTSAAGSTFPIVPSGGSDNNYTLSYVNGTLTVNKAPLVATADNKTRTYGVSNPPFTISYSGFVNSDDESDITVPTASTSALITSNVGNYAINLTGGSASNYTITTQAGTLNITKALLVVIGNDLSRAYGQPNPALTFKYIGFKNSDTETSVATPPTASTTATTASNVGTYPITITGGSATNYSLQNFDGTLTVTKATLIAKADDKSKTYGQANPSNSITYTGFVNGDNASDITPPTITGPAANASSNAGSYPITLSGGSAANYDLTLQNGALTINKAALTAKADNKSRLYGAVNPVFTITYTGFVNADDATDITEPGATTTAAITSDVGSYPITLSGGSATNYTFTLQPGSLVINAAPLTIKANDRTRTYGAAPPSTWTFTYTGFLNGDDATDITIPTASTTYVAGNNVGTYPISISGGSATNYTLTLQPGVLTIMKAVLIVKADDKTRPYGSANPPNSLSYEGFIGSDNAGSITAPGITGPAATTGSPVGTYAITLSGGSAVNYTLDLRNGTLTVTKVTLTAKADNKSRLYGAADPVFTITYTGFVNGENASAISPPLTATSTATVTSNVNGSPYPIKITPGVNTNYDFTYVDGTLTINKKPITVTADTKTRVYGNANPAFTLTYTGLANGETASVIDTPPTINVAANTATNASTTPIPITLSGGADNNYDMTLVNGSLTITKAPLTAKADNKNRPYGSANPVNTITYTGFKNGQTAADLTQQPVATTSATITSPVGNYPITLSGGLSTNYDITTTNGTLNVVPAVLTVTANNHARPYGSPNPVLTLSYSGFVNGQNISVINTPPVATTTATITSPAGTYPIKVSGGVDSNYSFYFPEDGTLTIEKAELTATADDKVTTYGTLPELTITYTGFVNGETLSVIDTEPVASTPATVETGPGTEDIIVTGGNDNNYTFTGVTGTLTINKAPLTVIADDKSRIIGLANPPLTISYTGFKNDDTEADLNAKPTATTTANINSAPGDYPINVAGGSDDHYDLIYQAGTLTVILDNAPIAKNFQVETDEDTPFNFSLSLFETNRTDDPNGKIIYVKVKSLPQNGVLFRGATRVLAGDEISVEDGHLSENLSYQPNSNYSGTDAFNWNMFDGSFLSVADATITIKIIPVNDPPVLSNIEPASLKYGPGDPGVPITQSLIINDVDDNFIFSASVLVATNFTDGDQLSVQGGVGDTEIEASYDPASGELSLTGKETRATYQNILTKVAFSSPVNGEATISEKVVTIVVRDSIADSNIASRKIDITAVFPELDIVNSFTPNGDAVNDKWDILGLDSYSDISVLVFTQDGAKVFECHEPNCLWDGTNKGVALPAGPYMYTIDVNNGKRKYKGVVNILK